MSTNVYERAQAVIEHEDVDEFLCHLACQLTPKGGYLGQLGVGLAKFLTTRGLGEKLAKTQRDYA